MLKSLVANEIELPEKAIALKPIIEAFKASGRREKLDTKWFLLCSRVPSLARLNRQLFADNRVNQIEFSALAARAYSRLFELKKRDLPYCKPSTVIEAAERASELMEKLPIRELLPGEAGELSFSNGLKDLMEWRPSDIPKGSTSRGKPEVRWLINRLAEEFCYSFAFQPPTAIIGDLVRLGWVDFTDRSLRNTLTNELLSKALKTAQIQRDNDNKSKIIVHQTISALPFSSKVIPVHRPIIKPSDTSEGEDKIIFEQIKELASRLSDNSRKLRLLSLISAMQHEDQNYFED